VKPVVGGGVDPNEIFSAGLKSKKHRPGSQIIINIKGIDPAGIDLYVGPPAKSRSDREQKNHHHCQETNSDSFHLTLPDFPPGTTVSG